MNLDQMKLTFKNTIIDQQEEARELEQTTHLIRREAEQLLLELTESKLVTVISGMRRTGKSTLALLMLAKKKYIYFNFDDEMLGQCKTQDLNTLLQEGLALYPDPEYLFFDEIQNIDKWELFINKLQRRGHKIIITGSNSRLLSSELATHLTGRHLSLTLYPFSFLEYLHFKKIKFKISHLSTKNRAELDRHFIQYQTEGSLPQLLQFKPNSSISKNYLKELFDKIVTRDIVQRRRIRNVKIMRELALLAISLYSSQFTYQSLKKSCGLNSLSITKNYIDYLTESYLIFVLEPYSTKIKARISLPKKLYVIDTLLADTIIPKTTYDLGKKLENLVYIELQRRAHETYYLLTQQYEVDFAIKEGRAITQLIQVCYDLSHETTREREIKSLLKGAREHNVKKLLILTQSHEEEVIVDGLIVSILPIAKWLLL